MEAYPSLNQFDNELKDCRMSQLPSTSVSTEETLQQMPVMQHLIVLRQYLFKIVGVTIFLFFCLLPLETRPINGCLNR